MMLIAVVAVSALACADAPAVTESPSTPVTSSDGGTSTIGTRPARAEVPGATVPPVGLRIDAIGVRAPVRPVGVEADGSMEVPPARDVGWYRFGPAPGSPGSTVLAAHVDYGGVEGAFFRLGDIEVGDAVEVTLDGGRGTMYTVSEVRQVPKSELDPTLFAREGSSRLALITCGGEFDRSTRSYRDNVVAIAVPASDG